MVNNKCLKIMGNLIEEGDYNIKLAVCNKETTRYLDKNYYDITEKWVELFRDTIGKEIYEDSENEYFVRCIYDKGTHHFHATGNEIIEACKEYIIELDVLRVDIIKSLYQNTQLQSFMIIKN